MYRKIEPTFNDGCVSISFCCYWFWLTFFSRKSICVTGVRGQLIFLVIRSMPDDYQSQIKDVVQACYPNDFLPSEHGNVMLKARHFCIWNQYAESVCRFSLSLPGGLPIQHREQVHPRKCTLMTSFNLPNMGQFFQCRGSPSLAGRSLRMAGLSTHNCLLHWKTSLGGYLLR